MREAITHGHQAIEITSNGETVVHLGDLCPTHAHTNLLWIMAYDNFPLEAVERKKAFSHEYFQIISWSIFYYDPVARALRLDEERHICALWPDPFQNLETP